MSSANATLEWQFIDGNWEARGADDTGRYVIYHYGRSGKVWRCEYYPTPRAFNSVSEIWLGEDIDKHKAKALEDHRARTRRLAWKRYMAQNDPPKPGDGVYA
jgi:hypothetical protein